MRPARTPMVLIAAGGLGREVASTVAAMDHYDLLGFVDDDPSSWGTVRSGALVLGSIATLERQPDAALVVCAGRGRDRARIRRRLIEAGVDRGRFPTIVDPSVWRAPDVVIGEGSIVLAGCVLTAGVVLGTGCVLMPNVTLTHDVVLEDHATVCSGVSLGGDVRLGTGAYVGMGASVRQRVRVGRDSTVGMGAAVIRDVPDDETWAGVPAQRVAARMEVR